MIHAVYILPFICQFLQASLDTKPLQKSGGRGWGGEEGQGGGWGGSLKKKNVLP